MYYYFFVLVFWGVKWRMSKARKMLISVGTQVDGTWSQVPVKRGPVSGPYDALPMPTKTVQTLYYRGKLQETY